MISINEIYDRTIDSAIFVTNAYGGISIISGSSTAVIKMDINILSGNKFSWYTKHNDSYSATYQMNITGCSYSYISLG